MKPRFIFQPLSLVWRPWLAVLALSGMLLPVSMGAELAVPQIPAGYKLLYQQQFQDSAAIRDFQFSDSKAWKFNSESRNGALELAGQSQYQPRVRSPFNIALIAGKTFGDFVLEADLIQTGEEYGHRDMCLFFGFQAPDKFYYAHLATAADDHAHNVFIVNEKPRIKIATQTTKGVNWGLRIWHKVRLERKVSDGSIRVFFDDMTTPIMVANDKSFESGLLGFGSFDDTGKVDNIRIWGPSMQAKATVFFESSRGKE